MKLKELCDISTNFEDAHFWIVRRGTMETVGSVTKEYNPEHIGVGVVRTDKLIPDYLYYALMNLHNQGYWKDKAKGTLRLVNIKIEDVKNIRIG